MSLSELYNLTMDCGPRGLRSHAVRIPDFCNNPEKRKGMSLRKAIEYCAREFEDLPDHLASYISHAEASFLREDSYANWAIWADWPFSLRSRAEFRPPIFDGGQCHGMRMFAPLVDVVGWADLCRVEHGGVSEELMEQLIKYQRPQSGVVSGFEEPTHI